MRQWASLTENVVKAGPAGRVSSYSLITCWTLINLNPTEVAFASLVGNLEVTMSNMESFAALFEESLSRQDMRSGEVISAEVVRLDHNFVIVNAGLKSEAFIPV